MSCCLICSFYFNIFVSSDSVLNHDCNLAPPNVGEHGFKGELDQFLLHIKVSLFVTGSTVQSVNRQVMVFCRGHVRDYFFYRMQ